MNEHYILNAESSKTGALPMTDYEMPEGSILFLSC